MSKMVTLTDIIKLSIEEIQAALFSREKAVNWDICQGLSSNVADVALQLHEEYGDFEKVVNISLASYFVSFLVLYFHKQGPVKTEDLLKIEPLSDILTHLGDIVIGQDKNYSALRPEKEDTTVKFLNRWMVSDLHFSARRAKENIILDLLIRFDQLNSTRLSSRLLNDIHYIVYSLAMYDDSISSAEQKLLEFLHEETGKVKKVIGDESSFDVESYGETLDAKSSEALLKEAREELGELIGLEGIKNEFTKLEAFLKIQKRREELDLAVTGLTLHFVFRGNPGTGKTTVARILGKLFRGVGFLKKGHVEETDRSGLIAEYLGQTAVKTKARAEQALDGILFIDEAYSLSRGSGGGGGNDAYGREAIETVLKFMEDNRKRIVVVVAGYPDLMNDFITTNPGLKSRFTRYLDFEDFQPLQLCQILQLFARKGQYRFTDEGVTALAVVFSEAYKQRESSFGNARFVRNLFEETLQNQAVRLSEGVTQPSKDELMTLIKDDIPSDLDSVSYTLTGKEENLPWCDGCDCRQPQCPPEYKKNT